MPPFPYADIEEQYAKDMQLKREDVAKLYEWQRMQPHLPTPLHPIETALFLHSCYYSNEAAKKCIECYYTCRKHYSEFFNNLDPISPEVQRGLNTSYMIALPDLTPEGYLVFFAILNDPNPDAFNFNMAMKVCEMMITLALKQRGCHFGHVFIFDLKYFKVGHLLKMNLNGVRKFCTYLQNALPLRLKSIHFVNNARIVDKLMMIIKPCFKKEIQDVFHTHFGDNSSIFKYVPCDILPIECGGLKFCAADYFHKVIRKDIEYHSEFFKQEERQVMDESKRPNNSRNSLEVFEIEGTFKNLNLD